MGCRSLIAACILALLWAPAAHADGIFISSCAYSHSAYDDPIVHKGKPGDSHRHDFFGNMTTDARSTARSLRRGATTCSPGSDRAAYWAPSMFKKNKVVKPARVLVYYMNQGGRKVRAFPRGLKMVAGDAHATAAQSPWVVNWSCEPLGRPSRGRRHERVSASIPSCSSPGVRLRVTFPSCWDGKRRDSRDHQRHMAYREWDWRRRTLACPSTHPVSVPVLALNITYPVRNGRKVFLASGRQRTAHADFFNGWHQGELDRLTRRCLRRSRSCYPRWG